EGGIEVRRVRRERGGVPAGGAEPVGERRNGRMKPAPGEAGAVRGWQPAREERRVPGDRPRAGRERATVEDALGGEGVESRRRRACVAVCRDVVRTDGVEN